MLVRMPRGTSFAFIKISRKTRVGFMVMTVNQRLHAVAKEIDSVVI